MKKNKAIKLVKISIMLILWGWILYFIYSVYVIGSLGDHLGM